MSDFYRGRVHQAGGFKVGLLADSITPAGVRVTTAEATFPRWMLPEINTHRLITRAQFFQELVWMEEEMSRNSASSRAVPPEINIANVRDNPYVPATFNRRVKGMGVGEEFSDAERQEAEDLWRRAAMSAVWYAERLNKIGLDKSRVNRLQEPFMWHTAIITATDWDNMFALRCPDGDEPDPNFPAQIEFQQLMILLRQAMFEQDPDELAYGEWHRPMYLGEPDAEAIVRALVAKELPPKEDDDTRWSFGDITDLTIRLCARRLARTSYNRQHDEEPVADSIAKATSLMHAAHWSPTEHIVRAIEPSDLMMNDGLLVPSHVMRDVVKRAVDWESDDNGDFRWEHTIPLDQVWCGNMRGVIQYRKLQPFEFDASEKREEQRAAL